LAFLGDGATGTTLGARLAHMSEWYRWVTAGRTFPITDAALNHLTSSMPADTGPAVLVWGDARMGNLMFADDWSVAAVLDWELASIGPAGIDLGWWLAFEEFATSAHGIEPVTGSPARDDTIARYEQLTGCSVGEPRWFETYALWVLTVTVIRMADIGVANGRLPADNRMGEGNLTAQMLARRLDLPVPDLDPHYAARRGLPVR
jgi:aminoglycoside phosphotransferase (APT) family kinase protein